MIVDGRRYANSQLNGFTQIAGKFLDARRWLGRVAGIDLVQHVRLDGDVLRFEVELTNSGMRSIALGYMRFADPDQSDLYETSNTATPGGVECKLQGEGGMFFLRDLAGKATVRTAPYNRAADLGTLLAVGTSRKGDQVVQLVFETVTLVPGQMVVHSFEMGVR